MYKITETDRSFRFVSRVSRYFLGFSLLNPPPPNETDRLSGENRKNGLSLFSLSVRNIAPRV